ncbi:hypothetical protein PGT21_007703 [Puccinia graminis f. sp. tritici]|uniref:Uncharacterized protein n=2 Tax=Puccinia graminis f. sp. tritici TaxID=56615 RepID=E3L5I9_PUCGT|nr:uncharacterized protein PGTG_17814 [Puccinia graminis f. sp. tritici CRL 75-36-700-3]EFP91814.2 hypothetical protein PGTG_17814 [Puccinia graminis f. sp. tritici CRL 75-36-700-3]KAA1073295.1 hypothetical protein PGT21_007703 [Puccinia graminis f. sp. tritici]
MRRTLVSNKASGYELFFGPEAVRLKTPDVVPQPIIATLPVGYNAGDQIVLDEIENKWDYKPNIDLHSGLSFPRHQEGTRAARRELAQSCNQSNQRLVTILSNKAPHV